MSNFVQTMCYLINNESDKPPNQNIINFNKRRVQKYEKKEGGGDLMRDMHPQNFQ